MSKKVMVWGSYVADLTGKAPHLPRAGETVFGNWFKTGPGGKGSNQAVAAHRAGADVMLVTKLGKDTFGDHALDFYHENNISTDLILLDEDYDTGIALICVDENTGQNQILVVPGACTNFTAKDIETLRPKIVASDILLVQLEINLDALERVVKIGKQAGGMIVLNPAPARKISEELLSMVDIITPNEVEAEVLTGVSVFDEKSAQKAAEILHANQVKTVVITMGKSGVFVSDGKKSKMVEARIVEAMDTTGAGDAFNGGFVTALAEGKDVFEAADFGNALASLSVQKFGTAPSMPFRQEIDNLFVPEMGNNQREV